MFYKKFRKKKLQKIKKNAINSFLQKNVSRKLLWNLKKNLFIDKYCIEIKKKIIFQKRFKEFFS